MPTIKRPDFGELPHDSSLEEIAKKELFIETLRTRNRDRYDFVDCSVWGILAALRAAYEAGRAKGSEEGMNSAAGYQAEAARNNGTDRSGW
jgi:hypothetical protein